MAPPFIRRVQIENFRSIAAGDWRQLGGALSASGRTLPGIEARTPSDHRERPGQKVASHVELGPLLFMVG